MYNPDELKTLYEFLQHTAQGNLKKMLCDQKFTDVHLNLLLKVAKSSTKEQFIQCLEKDEFPKIKMSANESKIREGFWGLCLDVFKSRGLMSPVAKAA